MNRTIEANFLPQVMEPIKEMTCILIIDDNRDFTRSAKLALERTGHYFVCEENDASKKQPRAFGRTLSCLISRCRKRMAAKSTLGFNPIPFYTEYQLSF